MANDLTGLLGGVLSNPLVGLGAGLLSAPQGSTFGQQIGGGIGFASNLQTQQAKNQLLREGLLEKQQQRQALEARQAAGQRLVGLLGGGEEGGAAGAPGGPSLGLLAEVVGPENIGGLLLNQMFAQPREQPADVRTLIAAGIDPRSPEGQDLLKRSVAGQDITGQLAQLQVMQTQLEIQRQTQSIQDARVKAEEAAREGRTKTGTLRREIFQQLHLGKEAAELLTSLEGTFGEAGFGGDVRQNLASGLALAQDMFGKDSSEAKKIASQMERLNSIATSFGLENFEAFSGAISDREVQIALGKDLSTNKTTPANRQALADRLSIALSQADQQGFEVADREEIEGLISTLRGGQAPASGDPAPGGEELGRMSDEEVLKGLGIR